MHFSCLEAAIQRAGNVSGDQAAVTGHRVFCACVAELFPGSDATRGHHALRVSVQRVEISKPRLDFSQSCARIARCRRHQISRDSAWQAPLRAAGCAGGNTPPALGEISQRLSCLEDRIASSSLRFSDLQQRHGHCPTGGSFQSTERSPPCIRCPRTVQ